MKPLIFTLLVFALLAALAPPAAEASGNVNFILGGRGLDEDSWDGTEEQGVFGVQVDWGPDTWPVKIAMGLSVSGGESDEFGCHFCRGLDSDQPASGDGGFTSGFFDHDERPISKNHTVTSGMFEYSAGVLYRPRGERKFIPYVGGGLAFMGVGQEISRGFVDVSDDDTTVGIYANGGVYWRLGKRFNIGVDGRIVTGTSVELFGTRGDANYGQLGLTLGWGW